MFGKNLLLAWGILVCGLALTTGCSDGGGSASAWESSWDKTIGIEGKIFKINSVTTDNDAVYVTGYTDAQELDGSSAGSYRNGFILKYDKEGNKDWSVLYDAAETGWSIDTKTPYIAADGEFIYTAANTHYYTVGSYSDGTVLSKRSKNTGSADQGWTASFTENYFRITGMTLSDKYVVLAGNGSNDIEIALYEKESSSFVSLKEIASDRSFLNGITCYENRLYLTGNTSSQLSWDGVTSDDPEGTSSAFTACFSINDAGVMTCTKIALLKKSGVESEGCSICGHDGYIYISGNAEGALGEESFGEEDMFAAKYSADLSELKWVKQYGKSGYETINMGISVSDSGIYITGDHEEESPVKSIFSGSKGIFTGCMIMENYDFDGNRIWSGEGPQTANSRGVAAADGAAYFAGICSDNSLLYKIGTK